jgi:hypothetical protein
MTDREIRIVFGYCFGEQAPRRPPGTDQRRVRRAPRAWPPLVGPPRPRRPDIVRVYRDEWIRTTALLLPKQAP